VLTELPSRTEITLEVDLSADETALYESLRRAALENLERSKARPRRNRSRSWPRS
jgi:SNF2 family DNA or RNA helicase